ncbi:hypothetical protein FGG08_002157 [Glutinoglossum americanum]|uniref:Major facilitator superfamily (MFS) profile domain-containing protein n=1 Tax=Glutinoglossum americanum TaxID=1670608 RepID=A0A9P8L1Y3_9PEZI|nr:hypothetical protein FGG08_002157 [Glutinoglossum americanum]
MGLGILQDTELEHVPGTCYVLDDESRPQVSNTSLELKYDRRGSVPIILVPQPSDDPNDPLNWPLWKRDLILVVLSVASVMAATLGPILAANTLTFTLYFRRDFTQIALLTGYHLCGCGVAGVLFVASARVWGKRHLYLLGSVLLIVGSAWAGRSRSYSSLLWARIIQGVAVAPFEALVNASVGDLYFVHQRGKRMALSNLSLFGGAFFTPVIVGKMTHSLGWPWPFYFVAIFSGVVLPMVFFLVPETSFKREARLNTDIASTDDFHRQQQFEGTPEMRDSPGGQNTPRNESLGGPQEDIEQKRLTQPGEASLEKQKDLNQGAPPEKVSFAKSLLPFNGRKTDESFFKLLLRPFPLFFHPAVLWACLIQGTLIGWTVLMGIVLAAIFLGPPLFFNEAETGYLYSGAFIGAVLGFVLAGAISDWSAKLLTRMNKGIYEPEFRMILVIPQMIVGCAGLYGFGITSNNTAKYGWFIPDFFFALEVMGMVLGAVTSALYIVDAHREIAVEAFTCLLMFKNFFSFGLTWSAYGWLLKFGITKTFHIIASVQLVVCLLTIPMFFLQIMTTVGSFVGGLGRAICFATSWIFCFPCMVCLFVQSREEKRKAHLRQKDLEASSIQEIASPRGVAEGHWPVGHQYTPVNRVELESSLPLPVECVELAPPHHEGPLGEPRLLKNKISSRKSPDRTSYPLYTDVREEEWNQEVAPGGWKPREDDREVRSEPEDGIDATLYKPTKLTEELEPPTGSAVPWTDDGPAPPSHYIYRASAKEHDADPDGAGVALDDAEWLTNALNQSPISVVQAQLNNAMDVDGPLPRGISPNSVTEPQPGSFIGTWIHALPEHSEHQPTGIPGDDHSMHGGESTDVADSAEASVENSPMGGHLQSDRPFLCFDCPKSYARKCDLKYEFSFSLKRSLPDPYKALQRY